MYLESGSPMVGAARARVARLLERCALDMDGALPFTVALVENGEAIASASLDGGTVKCVAVSPEHQGEDLCARLLTEVRKEALRQGREHLMLFTKPQNEILFQPLGFYPLARTADCLLMEDRRDGLNTYLQKLDRPDPAVETGCIAGNFNPFTLGHLYLIETAAKRCEALHLFVLSEERSAFPADARLQWARVACGHLKNVYFHPSGPYLISSATFPDYFIRDKARVDQIRCALDVRLFGERIAPALNIRARFVGTEPLCPVTRAYNEALKQALPRWKVRLCEIPRMEVGGQSVSASRVRALLKEGNFAEIRNLVPENVYQYLIHA